MPLSLFLLLSLPCTVFGPLSSQTKPTSNFERWKTIHKGTYTLVEEYRQSSSRTFCLIMYRGYTLKPGRNNVLRSSSTGHEHKCLDKLTYFTKATFARFNQTSKKCSILKDTIGLDTVYNGTWIDFDRAENMRVTVIAKLNGACPSTACSQYRGAVDATKCSVCVTDELCRFCATKGVDYKDNKKARKLTLIPFSLQEMMKQKCYPDKDLVARKTCTLPYCVDCTPDEVIFKPDPTVEYNRSQFKVVHEGKFNYDRKACGLTIEEDNIYPLNVECNPHPRKYYYVVNTTSLCHFSHCARNGSKLFQGYCNARGTCGWNATTHMAEVEACRNCGFNRQRLTVRLLKRYNCKLRKSIVIDDASIACMTECNCTADYEFETDFKNTSICRSKSTGRPCGKDLVTIQRRRRRQDCIAVHASVKEIKCKENLCKCRDLETYGEWKNTGDCNVTCGYGMREQTRTKIDENCEGQEKQTRHVECIRPKCDCTDDNKDKRVKNEWRDEAGSTAPCETECGINVTYFDTKLNLNKNCKKSKRNMTKICPENFKIQPCKCNSTYYGMWSDWSECLDFANTPPAPVGCQQSGKRKRTKKVNTEHAENKDNTLACLPIKTNWEYCNNNSCCPKNCMWGPYEERVMWLAQEPYDGIRIYYEKRQREVEADCNGKECDGEAFRLLDSTAPVTAGKDCQYSIWPLTDHSRCVTESMLCGSQSALMVHRLRIKSSAICEPTQDRTDECKGQWCPKACTWAEWSSTSKYPCAACKRSSVPVPTEPNSETFSRGIKRNATFGGEDCYSTDGSDTRECNKTFCKEPCKYSDWIKVDQCTGKCWSGFKYKYRRIEEAATAHGACNEDVVKTSECTQQQADDCPMDDVCRNFLKNSDDSTWTSCEPDEEADEKLCMWGEEPRFKTKSGTRYIDFGCSQDFKLDEQLCNDKAKLPCHDEDMYIEGLNNFSFKCVYTPWLAWSCEANCSGQHNGQVVQGKGTRKRFLIYGGGGKFPGSWNCSIDKASKTLGVQTEGRDKDCQVVCDGSDTNDTAPYEEITNGSSEEGGVEGWHIGVMVGGIVLVLLSIALCIAIVVFRRKAHKSEHPGKTKVVIRRKPRENSHTSETASTTSKFLSITSSTLSKAKSKEKGPKLAKKTSKSTEKAKKGRLAGLFGSRKKKQKQAKQAKHAKVKQKAQKQSKPGWKRKEEEAMSRKDESEKSVTMRTEDQSKQQNVKNKTTSKSPKNQKSKSSPKMKSNTAKAMKGGPSLATIKTGKN